MRSFRDDERAATKSTCSPEKLLSDAILKPLLVLPRLEGVSPCKPTEYTKPEPRSILASLIISSQLRISALIVSI